LSTSEQYVRSTLWLNYLLHGERVTSPEQIVSDEFRAYLQPLFPLLCPAPDGQPYVALYKSALPSSSLTRINEFTLQRHSKELGVKAAMPLKSLTDARLAEVCDLYEAPCDSTSSREDTEIDEHRARRDALLNLQTWAELRAGSAEAPDAASARYVAALTRLVEERAMVPCTDVSEEGWLTSSLPDAGASKEHCTFADFMAPNEVPRDYRGPVARADAPLWWVDLRQLRFKHGKIENEGDTVRTHRAYDYTVLGNVKRLQQDRHFYTRLMREARFSTEAKVIAPVKIFVMDGMLYSHDHKRVVASLAVGNRYLLATLEHDVGVITRRQIGSGTSCGHILFGGCAD
jgi:hypothetical protein